MGIRSSATILALNRLLHASWVGVLLFLAWVMRRTTLTNASFAGQVTGKKWSEAFPGVPPEPRTGHNDMIGLLQAAASGDSDALDAVTEFVQREADAWFPGPAQQFLTVGI